MMSPVTMPPIYGKRREQEDDQPRLIWDDYFQSYVINLRNPAIMANIVRQAEACDRLMKRMEKARWKEH